MINGKADRALIAHQHPRSPVSEAYRTVRTNLQFAASDDSVRLILITSAGPEEGKSTTLANLAVTLAQAGKRVLIVDADLRKPIQHKIFEVGNSRGLTNVLAGRAQVSEVIEKSDVPNLWVLTSGPIPPNPSELLNSEGARSLWTPLLDSYDYVLLDSPPAVTVTDAAILSTQVHGVLLVVRSATTRHEMLREVRGLLAKGGARILGAVLNGVQYNGDDYRYYYYYGHGSSSTLKAQ